tara:strand:+ start:6298 stop:6504 length:207 start_codon:yes stop_codon:yes gene_type:complete
MSIVQAIRKEKTPLYVEEREVYGEKRVYPTDHTGELLVKLTGNKTFSSFSRTILKQLGYEFIVKQKVL